MRALTLSIVGACTLVWALPASGQQQAARGWLFTLAVRDSITESQQAPQQRPRRRRSAGSSNVGYVDNAIVGNQLQLRYDFATGVNRPDRAEFIYAKCGCYRELGVDSGAPGPVFGLGGGDPLTTPFIIAGFDYHEVALDVEYALHERFSLFAEGAYRWLDYTPPGSSSGIVDVRVGFKIALVAEDTRYLTFQWGTYIPSGKARNGLGTDHVSLEPALLYHQEVSERVKVEGELRYWLPIGGSTALGTGAAFDPAEDFSAGVVRYGLGLGYDVSPDSPVRFTPVIEVVGWTVTGGIATATTDGTLSTVSFEDAGGTTIVNVKVGARFGVRENDAIFVGLGEALTSDVWYERVLRAEYRLVF